MKRVEIDNGRNNRLPKSVTVGYTMVPGGAWIGHSFRLPFPTEKDFNLRVQKLVDSTRRVLNERKHSSFIRIGFSAVDFVVRPKLGRIDSFFSKGKTNDNHSSTKRTTHRLGDYDKKTSTRPGRLDHFFSPRKIHVASPISTQTDWSIIDDGNSTAPPSSIKDGKGDCQVGLETDARSSSPQNTSNNLTDEEIARQLQETYNNETVQNSDVGRDQALASQLQSEFDRETAVLAHIEKLSPKGQRKTAKQNDTNTSNSNKRSKLDFFFVKK